MKLNELANNPGSTKNRKRIGRGPGSGTGKTSGHGHKGQKARKGVAIDGFEGGQNSIIRRMPKRGFTNIFKTDVEIINTGRLQQFIDSGKLDANKVVTRDVLVGLGLVAKSGITKLLASGELKSALKIEVDRASASAVKAIESVKGSVTILSTSSNS